MSIRRRYTLLPVPHPVVALGGRWVRPRPLIPITVVGPSNSWLNMGLLDSGADDTVFPEWVAAHIGIDLTNAPTSVASGVGMLSVQMRLAEMTLRIAGGHEQREWQAWVGFTTARLRRPLLGFAGFLQFFSAHFHGDREEVELTVNSLYAGS